MLAIVFVILLVLVCIAPGLWAKHILSAHAGHRHDFPGTGGEFARHLLDEAELSDVPVEIADIGDHYDPKKKRVCLQRENYEGRSLTAVVVAAHEVSHALQDREAYTPLKARTVMASYAYIIEILAKGVAFASVFTAFASPRFVLLHIAVFVILMLSRVVIHLVTLPVEIDASFSRALPILDKGNYLPKSDLPVARRILQACALTYVAAALMSIIDVTRFLRFGR